MFLLIVKWNQDKYSHFDPCVVFWLLVEAFKLASYQSIVFFNPSSNFILDLNPNSLFAFVTFNFLRGCPSGFVLSQTIFPLNPVKDFITITKSLIFISNPAPKFTGSDLLYFSVAKIIASAASSTYKNSLDALPVPHTTTSFSLLFLASTNFLIKAVITWQDRESKLSPGPYRFTGNKNI